MEGGRGRGCRCKGGPWSPGERGGRVSAWDVAWRGVGECCRLTPRGAKSKRQLGLGVPVLRTHIEVCCCSSRPQLSELPTETFILAVSHGEEENTEYSVIILQCYSD